MAGPGWQPQTVEDFLPHHSPTSRESAGSEREDTPTMIVRAWKSPQISDSVDAHHSLQLPTGAAEQEELKAHIKKAFSQQKVLH